jgi:hypothetical protein
MLKTDGPRVKGVSFRSVMRAVDAIHGAVAAETCLAALPGDLAQAFRYGQILASGWYPIEWYRDLLRGTQAATGARERGTFEIGRQCARQDMTGIYKLGFKLVSPEVVLRLSTRLFSNFYDTGQARILESRAGYARAEWTGCTGFDKNMWWEAFGAAEMFMELAGARHVRTRIVRGGEDPDEFSELTMHWT